MFSQIKNILAITGTGIDSLNNNTKNGILIEHTVVVLRRIKAFDERLKII